MSGEPVPRPPRDGWQDRVFSRGQHASFLLILWHYDAPFGDAQDVAERLVYLVLEILFAAWLVLGAPGLPALLAWARRAGLRPPS